VSIPSVTFNIQDGALGAVPPNVAGVCVKLGICSKGVAGVAASKLIGSTTMSDGVTFTAVKADASGNNISITYTTGASAGPVVTVNNNAINVQIKAGTTMNSDIVTAVAAFAAAAALVTGVSTGPSDLAIAVSQTFLTGGVTGTINGIFSETNPSQAISDLGYGPLTEAVVNSLNIAGGQVLAVPLNPSVAGTQSVVGHIGSGSPAVTVSGTPYDSWQPQFQIVQGGALGAATFKYSLDNGQTFSAVFTVPSGGSYVIPNTGITATFASGTYVAADVYYWTTTAPGFNITDVQNAFAALMAAPNILWGFLHLIGPAASVTAAASMAAALETLALSAASTYYRFVSCFMEVAQDTDAATLAAFVNTVCTRVDNCGGFANFISSIGGEQLVRNVGFAAASRQALVPAHESLGRVARGPVPGVISLLRNEALTPGLDAAGFTTMRTIQGVPGFFFTNGHMFVGAQSDYLLSQNRRVMDLACGIAYAALIQFLNDTIRVNKTGGTIANIDATKIENQVNAQLSAAVVGPGEAVASSVVIDRTNNVLATKTLNVTIRITPFGYAQQIVVNIGFNNPNLQLS
jgi:hypothetical protein